jgi:hypothetical protein
MHSAASGTLSTINVSPAAASRLVLAGLPSTTTAGVSQALTVTAEDPYGNVATGYLGTVTFTSGDSHAHTQGQPVLSEGHHGDLQRRPQRQVKYPDYTQDHLKLAPIHRTSRLTCNLLVA